MKFLLATLALAANALELTPENYEAETAGKTVFIKFFAPWCGHCKKMKPDWDKLMTEFQGNAHTVVADCDCTAACKPLCDANGVKGFPTLKYGDPSSLEDYQGGRDLATMTTFAQELKPSCSVANIALCDDEQKAKIETVQAMDASALDAAIEESESKLKTAEQTFEDEVAKLQATYQQLQKDKEDAIAEVKSSGLSLLKAVKAGSAAKVVKDEL